MRGTRRPARTTRSRAKTPSVGDGVALVFEPVDSERQPELLRVGRLAFGVLRLPVGPNPPTEHLILAAASAGIWARRLTQAAQ
ncbi:hypothetical protein [Catenulispora rubra]|uniref:hypothetical protein n=1 Tax=Catenulispora rubra TaxID=280293 RepID=UPI001892683B|nr:hypothetical protein [Catenulispora rubra]